MGVMVKDVLTADYKDRKLMANDVVLLVKKESYLWEAAKGRLAAAASCKFGLVGHVEHTRRSMEGLTIRMSREFWSEILGGNNGKIGTEMVLLKLGSNITSLREFTALCRMDSIPLLDYILGGKMNSKTCNVASSGSVANDLDDDEDDDKDDDTDPSTKQSFPA